MSAITDRVLIAGTNPNAYNANWILRTHAANGFRSEFPYSVVRECAWDEAYQAVEQLKPTLLIWMGGVMLEEFDLSITTNLAKRCGSKVAFWMHDDPYELDASFRIIDFADYIFTTDKSSVLHYPPVVPAFHLPLAACPFAHYRPILKRSGPDWFFCGVPFACRQEFFLNLSLITPSLSGLLLGPGWDLGRFSQAADIGVSSAQICNYYATALSVMYLGRDFNLANAKFGVKPSTPGPRMFEAAMAGAVQLVNTPGLEVLEYFGDRNEVIMVDTPEGASSIIFSLKSDPQRSIEIGGAAQRRALSEHTYAHRAKNMIATILG